MYDSRDETIEHINKVSVNLLACIEEINDRAMLHDQSKLASPEKEVLDTVGARLKTLTYNTPEYFAQLEKMKPFLDHHYAVNSHHPQYYPNGVDDMDLFDLMEMLADWKAATARMKDGNLRRSIVENQQRFNYSDSMRELLLRTADHLGWLERLEQ